MNVLGLVQLDIERSTADDAVNFKGTYEQKHGDLGCSPLTESQVFWPRLGIKYSLPGNSRSV